MEIDQGLDLLFKTVHFNHPLRNPPLRPRRAPGIFRRDERVKGFAATFGSKTVLSVFTETFWVTT